ncbi:MutS-related protein [Sphingobacterium sp. BIGb0116]|uniref:MutS-related protein n=1 Tax=Sphingobacterium sp. BIGb0116 TaxID=2940619 RepID=UPI002167207E|nr:DNA mismatch repair protein MutS [Sphingobacterium sp. BIGb0116]MCS4163590.1 DNA mismatch repair ATPase MutS [Sphingobacterium sp. BIGb0116]
MLIIDKQTLTDLNVTNNRYRDMIDFFDCTVTQGGRDMLYSYFLEPLSSKWEIENRQHLICFMQGLEISDLLDKYMMQDLEQYLSLPQEPYSASRSTYYLEMVSTNFLSLDFKKREILIKRSIHEIAKITDGLAIFLESAKLADYTLNVLKEYGNHVERVFEGIDRDEFTQLLKNKFSTELMIKYDYIFRNIKRNAIREIFNLVYHLDALSSVAKCSKGKELVFPQIDEQITGSDIITIRGAYNLFIEDAIKNDVDIKKENNLWYLTGANMTGKSTLLKTIGSCVYLAHLGFPVPADAMKTVLFDGISATINLGDNINVGASHFFNEVLRVKHLAELLASGKQMFVLMDELFKGTNHSDASEATLELVNCLKGYKSSVFLLSSHITEICPILHKDGIALKYLGVQLDEQEGIIFTYRLLDGVAEEKLGMWLLRKERVFEILFPRYTRV